MKQQLFPIRCAPFDKGLTALGSVTVAQIFNHHRASMRVGGGHGQLFIEGALADLHRHAQFGRDLVGLGRSLLRQRLGRPDAVEEA